MGNDPINFVDPNGAIALPAGVLAALGAIWAGIELGLSAYDIYDFARTMTDSCSSDLDKILSVSGLLAGAVLPGGGYGKLGKSVANAGEIFEESVKHTFRNKIIRQNEVLQDSAGRVLGEIDFETAEAIVEVGLSLRGKLPQLHKLGEVSQDRAKRLDVVYGPATSQGTLKSLKESLSKKWGNRVRFIPHP